jgi:hypothetical protein
MAYHIEVDFETWKEINYRRSDETVSEGDVVKEALGLRLRPAGNAVEMPYWESEGVRFPIGSTLEHKFRDGRLATARVTSGGLEVGGQVYPGLSPAGVAVTGHQLNGWLFWFLRDNHGKLVPAASLRTK